MKVERATIEDMERILTIYQQARQFMRENGNPSQWGEDHPCRELLVQDIEQQQLFVVRDEMQSIQAVFALIFGFDPTYSEIEDGMWPNELPYATLHRVASAGLRKGMFDEIVAYTQSHYDQIRIDTHRHNKAMKEAILRTGFQYCGIIYVEDGTPRDAYCWNRA